MDEEKEVALVTGAGRGDRFLRLFRRLVEDGFHVVMVDVKPDPLAQNAAALKPQEPVSRITSCPSPTVDAVSRLIGSLTRLDCPRQQCGGLLGRKVRPDHRKDFRKMYDVIVVGAFVMTQEAVKVMKRGARIINVASRAYLAGYAHAPYITSKAGTVGLTRSMASILRHAESSSTP